jgi:hypothetical protein
LFCDGPKDRDDSILEDSARIEVRLHERMEPNAVAAEAVEVLQRFQCALARQSAECPEYEDIEAALGGVSYHGLKLSAIGFAAGIVIFVLANDHPVLSVATISTLVGLVGGLLTFVFS